MWRQVISYTLKRRHSFVQSKYHVPLIVAWFHTYIHPTPRILTFALISQSTTWSSCCVNSSKLRKTSKNCNVLITFSGVDTSDFGQPQPLQRHLMHRSDTIQLNMQMMHKLWNHIFNWWPIQKAHQWLHLLYRIALMAGCWWKFRFVSRKFWAKSWMKIHVLDDCSKHS